MLKSKIYLCLLFCASLTRPTNGQQFRSLSFFDKAPIALSQPTFAIQLPMKCGPDGTIYLRFAEAGGQGGVTLVREDGGIASNVRLSEIPEFSENDFYDFAPANGYVLVLSGQGRPHVATKYFVSRFKTDGTYVSSVRVNIDFRPDFEPRHIAEFGTGDLLIAGIAKGHDVPFVPFTAIFGSDGEFRREIVLKDDVTEKDAKQKPSDAKLSEAQRVRDLLDVTFLQTADDGNIYIMRHTPKGPVFVVSPGGAVRRVSLLPAARSADIQWIMASGGAIAAQYRSQDPAERKTHYISIIDLQTNKVRDTIRYTHDLQTNGGGMVCYQHDIFTFIAGAPEDKLQLVKAAAQ